MGSTGNERLRLALRVLWRHWKAQDALPYDIVQAAAVILHFRCECEQNSRNRTSELRHGIESDLRDVAQGAFELLSGQVAETEVVRRADLGE